MSTTPVQRVGILGFGFIGQVHAYAYRTLPFYCRPVPVDARITHVVTGRPETAAAACRLLGADNSATDFRVVTENADIDIVHICTPNHLHHDALQSALQHGKHIYCDKPLVATWPEACAVAAHLKSYSGTAQMTFQNRFFPAMLRARQLVQTGCLGKLLGFRAAYLHGGSADPRAPLRWKLTAAAGGGVIADLGSHVLDLVEYLLGPIGAVCATTSIAYGQRPAADDPHRSVIVDAEDTMLALARLESGVTGTLEATKVATGTEDELRLEVHGSQGALRFDLMDPHHLWYYDNTASAAPLGGRRGWTAIAAGHRYEPPATEFPSAKASIGWIRSHVACLAHFLEAVRDRRPAEPDLAQGVHVQQLMEAVRVSAHRRCWVEVNSIEAAAAHPASE